MRRGITFLEMLTILFIGLKLTGYIELPWWQVALPLLLQCVVGIILSVIYVAAEKHVAAEKPWWEK